MEARTEIDSLGKRKLPKEAYYGIQTLRAVENFPVSGLKAPKDFVRAYAWVKKAAALANMRVGWLDGEVGMAIVNACEEVLDGKLLDQFVVDVFQAGAGTSFNMNLNEVVANRALEILGRQKGDYKAISPNDHVNMAQSSNDTFPTALHIYTLTALKPLLAELTRLSKAFRDVVRKNKDVIKIGRTHLQDALPITFAQEFGAYATAIENCRKQIETRSKRLLEIALGATAVGTGANTHPQYKKIAISELSRMAKLKLKAAKDPFEALQSRNAIAAVSSALKELALELTRIANDLRLLSSGPPSGLAEITLPAVQLGSSIMPGKVNPVMAECLNMVCYQIIGNDNAVSMAVQAGQLDLNVMTPLMLHNMSQSIQLLTNYLPAFREKCVEGIKIDKERCAHYLEMNPALATFLSPYIGYLEASKIAQQAMKEKRSIKELILEKRLLKPGDVERIFSVQNMLQAGKTVVATKRRAQKKVQISIK